MNSRCGLLNHVTAQCHQPFQVFGTGGPLYPKSSCQITITFGILHVHLTYHFFKHACSPYLWKFQEEPALHIVSYGYAYSDAMLRIFGTQDSQRTTPRSDFGCHPLGSNTLVGKCALGPDLVLRFLEPEHEAKGATGQSSPEKHGLSKKYSQFC